MHMKYIAIIFNIFNHNQMIYVHDENDNINTYYYSLDEIPEKAVEFCYKLNMKELYIRGDVPDYVDYLTNKIHELELSIYNTNTIEINKGE